MVPRTNFFEFYQPFVLTHLLSMEAHYRRDAKKGARATGEAPPSFTGKSSA